MSRASEPPPLLRRLFEVGGWTVEDVPGGWRAVQPDQSNAVITFFGSSLPAGFQHAFLPGARKTWLLWGHMPDPSERDRVELSGAVGVEPDEVPARVLHLLHPDTEPPPPAPMGPPSGPPPSRSVNEPAPTGPDEPSVWSEDEPTAPPPPWRPVPGTPASPLTQEPLALPPLVFERDRIVRPRLLEEDVFQMARGRWRGGQPKMVLVPFYLFAYTLPEDDEATGGPSPARLVAVPAVGGLPQFWGRGEREIVSAVAPPHSRIAPRLRADEARARALAAIRDRHAHSEDRAEQRRGVLVIESHRDPRREEDVRLGPPALLWVPHWLVEAWNGRELLDAVTGHPAQLPLDAP